jgi:hypothetical protein
VVGGVYCAECKVESEPGAFAEPGDHFVTATVNATNVSGRVQTVPLGFDFELRDAAGHHYSTEIGLLDTVPLGGLDPQKSAAGEMAFEVPNGDKNLTLYFTPDILPANQVVFPVPG